MCCLLPAIYCYVTGRAWLAVFLLFFLTTAGFQMIPVQWMVMPPLGITKAYDWGLLFTVAIVFIRPKLFAAYFVWNHFRILAVYCLFLVVLLLYSIFVKEIELSVTIRVFRNFIFFISLFLFLPLRIADFEKIWRLVIYATSIASLVYCLQPLLHKGLLNKVISDLVVDPGGGIVSRYYNVPVLICPVLFFLFFPVYTFRIRFRNLQLGICMLAVLLTQHRNLIVAVLLCFFLYLIINNKLRLGNAILYCALSIGILIGADDFMGKRLSKGVEDVGNTSLSRQVVQFHTIALSDLSTTEFRKLLFMERWRFVSKDETRAVFGIGLMTDDSKKARTLRFYIGAPDDDGNISQVANIDIVWAGMLLQLGIVGSLIFIFLHLFLVRAFFTQKRDPYMQTGIFYIVSLFVTSFYGSTIAMPYTMCMTMLFAAYYFRITLPGNRSEKSWPVSISR
ncbi:MAG TPA: hypothetical protein VL727_18430 [Puia sp.]|nr:hypothetical protein [Puia sp.]